MPDLLPVFSRFEPTTDSTVLTYCSKTEHKDVVIYKDPFCKEEYARIPWFYKGYPRNLPNLKVIRLNCYNWENHFLGWYFRNEEIVETVPPMTRTNPQMYTCVVTTSGWTDYPIIWPNGIMAWDFPERINNRLKRCAYRLLTCDARYRIPKGGESWITNRATIDGS